MKHADIVVRESRAEDALGIARVHIQSWQETYKGFVPDLYLELLNSTEGERRREMWKKTLADPKNCLRSWVAAKGDEVIGFVTVGKCGDEKPIAEGELYAIYLLKAHQGSGVGRALFEAGFNVLKKMGMKSASLWVVKGNPTEGFYSHMGGRVDGEKIDQREGWNLSESRYVWNSLEATPGT